jgi:orotidine-5'-phosphate decarboxylase
MSECECIAKLEERWKAGAYLSIGLDSDFERLPGVLKEAHGSPEEAVFVFNRDIIEATARYAAAWKPNSAFYEALGDAGMRALKRTISYAHEHHPDIPVILDAKRGDIGSTMDAYARGIFDELEADAATVSPYLGREAAEPFLERKDRGVFVLAKTSNPGSGEFQDLTVGAEPLYLAVARRVAEEWNTRGNCGIVAGATYPEEAGRLREAIGELPILMPGFGAQGGDASVVSAAKAKRSFGLIVNSSRGIIFASSGEDYADAAALAAAELSEKIVSAG